MRVAKYSQLEEFCDLRNAEAILSKIRFEPDRETSISRFFEEHKNQIGV